MGSGNLWARSTFSGSVRVPLKKGIFPVNHPQRRGSLFGGDRYSRRLPRVGVGVISDMEREAGKKGITFVTQTRHFSEFRILMLLCRSLTPFFLPKLY